MIDSLLKEIKTLRKRKYDLQKDWIENSIPDTFNTGYQKALDDVKQAVEDLRPMYEDDGR